MDFTGNKLEDPKSFGSKIALVDPTGMKQMREEFIGGKKMEDEFTIKKMGESVSTGCLMVAKK